MRAFDTGNARGHGALVDDRDRPGGLDRLHHAREEAIEILAIARVHGEPVTRQGFAHVVARKVLRGVAGNGDVIVVHHDLDVDLLGNGQAGGFGVVAFLLRTVRAEHEHDHVRVGQGNAVHEGPHVAEASGGELDAEFRFDFRMAIEPFARRAVLEQFLEGHFAVERGHGVLDGDAVAAFIEVDRIDLLVALHEAVGNEDFRNNAVGAAGMPAQALHARHGGEEDDGVAQRPGCS